MRPNTAVMRQVVVLAVLLLTAATGCARIPSNGPVTPGGRGAVQERPLQPIVAAPPPGASPHEVVRGFLDSMVSSTEEYQAARGYLTRERASSWQPRRSVVIFEGAPRIEVREQTQSATATGAAGSTVKASVTVTPTATLDQTGAYAPTNSEAFALNLGLRREGEEWRIQDVPDALVLSSPDFHFTHRSYPVYFLTTDAAHLVPVRRWLPAGGGVAARLVEQVLAGPPEWLRPALITAAPDGTRLAPPASVISDGRTAILELTSQARSADPTARVWLRAQLTETLRGVLDADEVELRVDGGRLDVPDLNPPRTVPSVASAPVLVRGGRIVTYDGSVRPVESLPDLSGLGATHPAVEPPDGGRAAVLTSRRTQLRILIPGQPVPEPVVAGEELIPPSVDRAGWVWSGVQANRGSLLAVGPDAKPEPVKASWLASRRIDAVRISLDATMAAVVSTSGGVSRLDIAAVRREDSRPVELVRWEPGEEHRRTEGVKAVAWVGPSELVVLQTLAGKPHVIDLPLDGPELTAPAPPGGVSTLAARGLGVGSLLLGTDDGTVYTREGAVWLPVRALADARFPAYPG